MHLNSRLQNGGHFVSASMCQLNLHWGLDMDDMDDYYTHNFL